MTGFKSLFRSVLLILLLSGPAAVPAIHASGTRDSGGNRYRIEFTGQGRIPRQALLNAARREITSFNSSTGTAADIADAAYTMELYLRNEGYAESSVQFRFFRRDSRGVRTYLTSLRSLENADGIEFIVSMGRIYRLGTIRFSGNTAYDEEYLRQFFTFEKRSFLNTGDPIYTARDLRSGISGIEELYLIDGYYRIEVSAPNPVLLEDGTAHITVFIREGPRFILGKQTIESSDLNPVQIEALQISLPLSGRPFYVRLAAEGATSLRTTLGEWGYNADITYDVTVSETGGEEGLVSIRYSVQAGKPLVLQDLRIVNESGKPLQTRESLIASRFPFTVGDTLDRQRLNQGLSRLYSLGIFSSISIDIVPEEDTGDPLVPADLVVRVTESDNRFVEVVTGWGTWELLRGSLRYTDLNLFGWGRVWTLDLSGNFKGYRAGTTIQDRVLFGPASLLSLGVQYRYDVQPSFTLTEGNATALFGYEPNPFWTLNASYTYALSRTDTDEDAEPDEFISTGRIALSTEYDSRDSALLPRSGYRVSGGMTYSSRFFGSERDFLDYRLQAETYIPLFGISVLAFSGNIQTKQILDDIPTLPIQERLFLGGDNSVRSFGKDRLGPAGSEGQPEGGLTSLSLTAELRTRIWRELHLALFYDFGILSPTFLNFNAPPGHGVGAGLRYYLPVGPVRLDAAWNPGEIFSDTDRWEIHFAVGFSF